MKAIRVALIAALVGFLAPLVSNTPASAEFTIHDYNMCHRKCSEASATDSITYATSPNMVLYLVSITNPDYPLAVSLQEVCFSQISSLISGMASLGYSYGGWTNVVTASPGGSCGTFGNAIFHLGNFVSSFELNFTAQYPGDDNRGMVCVKYDVFAHPVTCSAHLSNDKSGSPAYHYKASDQAIEYADEAANGYVGSCRQAAGDFNLTPSELTSTWKTPKWDPGWDEVDQPSPWQATSGSDKIDWVWISDSQHSNTFSLGVSAGPPTGSDHRYLVPHFTPTSCP